MTTTFPSNPATALLIGDLLWDVPTTTVTGIGIRAMLEEKKLGLIIKYMKEQLLDPHSEPLCRKILGDRIADLIINY